MVGLLETKLLRNFVAVATTGSISKAAEICYVAQPALSVQMRSLEEQLQVQLFERSHKGVVLTSAGALLLEHAMRILTHIEQAISEVKELELVPKGTVSIGMPLSVAKFIAAPLVQRTLELYPSIFIQVLEISSGYVPDMLIKGDIDLGITFKKTDAMGLVSEEMMTESLAVIAPRHLVTAPTKGVDFIRKNLHLPYILPPKNHGLRDVIRRIEQNNNVELNVIAEVNTISLLIDLSLKGVGATILAFSSVSDLLDQPAVIINKIDDPVFNRSVYMCYSSLRKKSLAVNVIKDLIHSLV